MEGPERIAGPSAHFAVLLSVPGTLVRASSATSRYFAPGSFSRVVVGSISPSVLRIRSQRLTFVCDNPSAASISARASGPPDLVDVDHGAEPRFQLCAHAPEILIDLWERGFPGGSQSRWHRRLATHR